MPCPFRTATSILDMDPFALIPSDHSTDTRHRRLKLYFACWLACRCSGMEPSDVDRILSSGPNEAIRIERRLADPRVHTWVSYWPRRPDFAHKHFLATFISMYVQWCEGKQPPPAVAHIRTRAFCEWLSLVKPNAAVTPTVHKLLAVLTSKELAHDPV